MVLASAGPIRRSAYEVFYYLHRVAAVAGVVFTLIHADYAAAAMVFPLVLYLLSLLWRWFTCVKYLRMNAALSSCSQGTVSVTLLPHAKTRVLVERMNPCSYFWVHCSDVSMVQWHPFSAIVTPQRDWIGFVVRSMGQGTFSHRLQQLAQINSQTKVTLCGPFGHIGLPLHDYEVIVLVAGGVGIAPLLSLVNNQVLGKYDHKDQGLNLKKKKLWAVWSVREASDLLMMDDFVAKPTAGVDADLLRDERQPSDIQLQPGARVHWMRSGAAPSDQHDPLGHQTRRSVGMGTTFTCTGSATASPQLPLRFSQGRVCVVKKSRKASNQLSEYERVLDNVPPTRHCPSPQKVSPRHAFMAE